MRNVFATFLVVFIILSSGAYGISWYAQASSTKRSIEAFIEKLNEKQKVVTYESIETSGFPSNVFVSIVKPHFKGRIDELLKAASSGQPTASEAAMQPLDEDIILDGKITVGINALSDQYSIGMSGQWLETTSIAGQSTSSVHQLLSDLTCSLNLKRETGLFDTLWNFKTLNRDGNDLIKDFRVLDCNTAGQKSFDTTTKEILSSVGVSRLYITNTPQQDSTQLRFYLKVTDAEVTALGDTRMINVIHAISPNYELPINFSAYGKQALDVDFTYYGPKDFSNGNKNPAIDIALNKMELTNNVYSYNMLFHLNNTPVAATRSSTLSFKTEAQFGEQYDSFVQKLTHNFINQIATIKDPKYQHTQEVFKQYTPEQFYAIVYPAIPSFHALGKVVVSLDGNYKGSEDFMNGDYALDALELSATPYGIVSKGNLKVASTALPSGTIQISCSNCMQMIDDMVAYSAKIQKIMVYYNPDRNQTYAIDPQQAAAIKQFLSLLAVQSDPADKTTLAYVISGSGMNITINNKSMMEISKLYNEYVRPTLKQQPVAPPALVAPKP